MEERDPSQPCAVRTQEELQARIRELITENGHLRGLLTRLRTENLLVMDEAQRLREDLERVTTISATPS